jgi:SLT domain-containing protein
MSDLSFNVIALDNASRTFIKLSEQVERFAERLDKLDRKDVNVKVDVKTDKAIGNIDLLETRFQKIAAGIIATSGFAGAAVIGGLGASFIGIAGLAQKSNKDVQESFQGLWRNIVATSRNATDQLVPQIVGAGNALSAEVVKLGPEIDRAFSFAGPSIIALTNGLTAMADNAMPGVTDAMQNSLPVMEGFSSLMGQIGTSAGQTLSELSEHSDEFGVSVQSLGGVVSAAGGVATSVIVDLNHVWAQNAGGIVAATEGVGESITGVAGGAVPVLSAGLQVLTGVVTGVTDVLGPVAPILGTVGTAALATWAAIKLAGLATTGVNLLATGVLNLGANMEAGATKAAGYIAAQRGVAVQSSATAAAVTVAGAATARASIGFAAAASSLAGPIGLALVGGTILFGLLSDSQDHAAESTLQLKAATDALTSAFQTSHGAVSSAVESTLQSTEVFKQAAAAGKLFGISQAEILRAVVDGGPALDALREKISKLPADFGIAAQGGKALQVLIDIFDRGQKEAGEFAAAQVQVGSNLLRTSEYQMGAARTASALGLGLSEVAGGFRIVIASGQGASNSLQDVSAAFISTRLAVAQAVSGIQEHFIAADRAVEQAQTSLADANHSYAASARSAADAQHSLAGAQRALRDAYAGVGTAQQAVIRAQEGERRAQLALNEARQQAIQDLKELHLQMEGQVVSEQQARLRLFDVLKEGKGLGITAANAKAIAAQEITDENEDKVKAALEIVSAQNSLNEALNSGQKLRKEVAEADAAGVDGAKGVVSAQESLRSAHEQVASAMGSLTKAQQQVQDANYSLKRAHQAVEDAEYQRERSANRVRLAQLALKDAQDDASRSLDINTQAGQNNLRQIMGLWTAIAATGMSTQDKYNTMIAQTATAFGMSTEAAQGFLTKLGLIPPDFKFNVTAVAGADLQAITEQTINGVKIFTSSLGSGGVASSGRLAAGGRVIGPGGPTDDMVPLWGSHGEFMQPADAVNYYGVGTMEMIRQKKLRIIGGDGAMIPGYARGGLIDAFAALTNLSTAYLTNVNALEVMGLPHPPQLPKYVPPSVIAGPGGPVNFTPGAGVAQWTPQILQALSLLGQPSTWLATVQRRMNQESGGNPTVVNRWDSNWARGTPSVGLMQVIGPTFRRWAGPFLNTPPQMYGTSVDPLANIFAGLNYAIHRYGSLSALNRPGGYDNGGVIMPGWTAVYNGTGRPENVRSSSQEDDLVAAIKANRPIKSFTLNAYVSDRGMDVRQQFRRMEMMELQ